MSTATTHIKKEKVLVPELRFKEFVEEWKNGTLGDYYNKLSTGMTPSRRNPEFFKGDIPWITSGELNYGYIYDTIEKITESGKEDATLTLYEPNTLFIAITGLEAPGTRGKCAINTVPATTNQSCMAFRKNEDIDTIFLFQWYKHMGIRLFYKYAQGTKQQSFNAKLVQKFVFNLPSHPEQQKIASFLIAVDEKIQQLTKKKELLEQYKKGVMQQLFSGQLRFKDENGNPYPDWEEKRLGEVGNIVSGLTYSPDDIDESGVLVLRSSNVHGRQVTFDDNVYVNVVDGKFNPVEENDVLICVRNGSKRLIGKNALIKGKAIGVAFGAFMTVYRSASNLFLFHYFDTVDYKKEVHKNLGATINSINGSDLKKFKIPFPSLPEQQKIATYLSSIDTKIENVNNQITQTQTFKKGLLQQMFV